METGFSADFSGVRIHQGADAVAMNRDLKAQAFTHGKDIFFNSGKYEPESTRGKMLLAHELTHVVQQGAAEQKLAEGEVKQNNAKRNDPIPEPTDKATQSLEQENAEKIKANASEVGEQSGTKSGSEALGVQQNQRRNLLLVRWQGQILRKIRAHSRKRNQLKGRKKQSLKVSPRGL